jgi:hypothetical protein
MADVKQPEMVLPFVGLLIAPELDADEVVERVSADVIGVGEVNGPFDFGYTDYYEPEMGGGLRRYWALGVKLLEPDNLVELKSKANELERELAVEGKRRVNVDPGYVSEYAVVAATCKALPASLYLGKGVYGYLLFLYRSGTFEPLEWTYPDYRDHVAFFDAGRRRMFDLRKVGLKR